MLYRCVISIPIRHKKEHEKLLAALLLTADCTYNASFLFCYIKVTYHRKLGMLSAVPTRYEDWMYHPTKLTRN